MGLYLPGERWILQNPRRFTLIVGGASVAVLGFAFAAGAAGSMSIAAAANIGTAKGTASITAGLVAGGVGIGGIVEGFQKNPSVTPGQLFPMAIPTPMGVPWGNIGDFVFGPDSGHFCVFDGG